MEVPVYIFESGERTRGLSVFCFEKLGHKDVKLVSEGKTFKDKYILFAEAALESESDYFIRSDSDCLAFEGVTSLLNKAIKEGYDWLTGVYFDYVMNRFRGGTPQILSRAVLEILVENNDIMPDSNKPETDFSIAIKDKVAMGDVNIFTNLHEFEQFPSKVCNSFLNRMKRGHNRLYNNDHLGSLPTHYRKSIEVALKELRSQKEKDNMHYQDFKFLDDGFVEISVDDYEKVYSHYSSIFDSLNRSYTEMNP